VQAAAVIRGDIKTPCLVVEDGATVCGHVHMAKPAGTFDPGSDRLLTPVDAR